MDIFGSLTSSIGSSLSTSLSDVIANQTSVLDTNAINSLGYNFSASNFSAGGVVDDVGYSYCLNQSEVADGTQTFLSVFKKAANGRVTSISSKYTIDVPYRIMVLSQQLFNSNTDKSDLNKFLGDSDKLGNAPAVLVVPIMGHMQLPLSRSTISSTFLPAKKYAQQKDIHATGSPFSATISNLKMHDVSSSILVDTTQSDATKDIIFILINARVIIKFNEMIWPLTVTNINDPLKNTPLVFDYTLPVLMKYEYIKSGTLNFLGYTHPFDQKYIANINGRADNFTTTKGYDKPFIPGYSEYLRSNYFIPTSLGCLSSMCLDGDRKLLVSTILGRPDYVTRPSYVNSSQQMANASVNRSWKYHLHTVSISTIDHDSSAGEDSLVVSNIFPPATYETLKNSSQELPVTSLSIAAGDLLGTTRFFIAISHVNTLEIRSGNYTGYSDNFYCIKNYTLDSIYSTLGYFDSKLYLINVDKNTSKLYFVDNPERVVLITSNNSLTDDGKDANGENGIFKEVGTLGSTPSYSVVYETLTSISRKPFLSTNAKYPVTVNYSCDKSTCQIGRSINFIGYTFNNIDSSFLYINKFLTGAPDTNAFCYFKIDNTFKQLSTNRLLSTGDGSGIYSISVPDLSISKYSAPLKNAYSISYISSFAWGTTVTPIYNDSLSFITDSNGGTSVKIRVSGCYGIYKANSDPKDASVDAYASSPYLGFVGKGEINNDGNVSIRLNNSITYNLLLGGTSLQQYNYTGYVSAVNYNDTGYFDIDTVLKLDSSKLIGYNDSEFTMTCKLDMSITNGYYDFGKTSYTNVVFTPPEFTAEIDITSTPEINDGNTLSPIVFTATGVTSTNKIRNFKIINYNIDDINNSVLQNTINFPDNPYSYTLYKGQCVYGAYQSAIVSPNDSNINSRLRNYTSTPSICCVKDHQYSLSETYPKIEYSSDGTTWSDETDALKTENNKVFVISGETTPYFKSTFEILHRTDNTNWVNLNSFPKIKEVTYGIVKKQEWINSCVSANPDFKTIDIVRPNNGYSNLSSASCLIGYNTLKNASVEGIGNSTTLTDINSVSYSGTLTIFTAVPTTNTYILICGCLDVFNQASLFSLSDLGSNRHAFRF
jgi:hypothetical protein